MTSVQTSNTEPGFDSTPVDEVRIRPSLKKYGKSMAAMAPILLLFSLGLGFRAAHQLATGGPGVALLFGGAGLFEVLRWSEFRTAYPKPQREA